MLKKSINELCRLNDDRMRRLIYNLTIFGSSEIFLSDYWRRKFLFCDDQSVINVGRALAGDDRVMNNLRSCFTQMNDGVQTAVTCHSYFLGDDQLDHVLQFYGDQNFHVITKIRDDDITTSELHGPSFERPCPPASVVNYHSSMTTSIEQLFLDQSSTCHMLSIDNTNLKPLKDIRSVAAEIIDSINWPALMLCLDMVLIPAINRLFHPQISAHDVLSRSKISLSRNICYNRLISISTNLIPTLTITTDLGISILITDYVCIIFNTDKPYQIICACDDKGLSISGHIYDKHAFHNPDKEESIKAFIKAFKNQ